MRYLTWTGLMLFISILLVSCTKEEELTAPLNPSEPSVSDPVASFTFSGDTVTWGTVKFWNTSQHADSCHWDFGDGATSTLTNPSKSYDYPGTYTVTLTVTNTTNNHSASGTKKITITPSRVFLTRIYIDKIPFEKENGLPWDIGDGPDLYPVFQDEFSTLVSFRDEHFMNFRPVDLPFFWTVHNEYPLTDWKKPYFVAIWDYDLIVDDYVGAPNGFTIDDVIHAIGYGTEVILTNSNNTIQARVNLRWE